MKPPFETLVTMHGAVVLKVAQAMVGRADADDAWSETFLTALKRYPELDHADNLQGWLVTIAHNKSVDILRRRRPTTELTGLTKQGSWDELPGEYPELLDSLGRLTAKQRQAVVLRHIADWTYGEVAQEMNITEAAARRNVSDALANLRTKLSENS